MIRGIDVAMWKLILSHTKLPILRSVRRKPNNYQQVQRRHAAQTQTLELYDGDLLRDSERHSGPYLSPLSSQDTQSSDLTSSTDASDSPALMIWPDASNATRDSAARESTVWLEGDSALADEEGLSSDVANDGSGVNIEDGMAVGRQHNIVTFFAS